MKAQSVRTTDGASLWSHRSGNGPIPTVLCHGGPGWWDYLGGLADLLADHISAHRWDQRGGGRSDRTGPYTVAQHVSDLDNVITHYRHDKVSLIGHSWGALLALVYTLRHPHRVRSLIYISGNGIDDADTWRDEYKQRHAAALGPLSNRLAELQSKPRTPEEEREMAIIDWSAEFTDRTRAQHLAAQLITPWFEVNRASNAALRQEYDHLGTPQLLADCTGLRVPVLIVDGARDIRPRRAVDSLAAAIPNARRVTLPDAGHLPWIEDAHGFTAAVTGFLATPS